MIARRVASPLLTLLLALPLGAAAQTCRDAWYGGCPDSCTTDYKRLVETGQLTPAALAQWAEICLKTTEEPEQRNDSAISLAQSGGEGEEASQSQSQQSAAEDGQEEQQEQQEQQGQQESASDSSAGDTQEEAAAAEARPQSGQDAQASPPPGAAEAGQQGASRSGAQGDGAPEGAQGAEQGQQEAADTGEGEEDDREAAAGAAGQEGESAAGAAGEGTAPPAGSEGERPGAARAAGGPGESAPEEGEPGGTPSPGSEGAGPGAGDAATGAPVPEGDPGQAAGREGTGPGGPGTVGRAPPGASRADEAAGEEDLPVRTRPTDRSEIFAGRSEMDGPQCGRAAAPMCGGVCDAGICVPDSSGTSCSCQPARTPSLVQDRRRALCPVPGAEALRVDYCRVTGGADGATCLIAFDRAPEAGRCTTIWSKPYGEIPILRGGRGDLDLRMGIVPLWDWKRAGQAIDHVTVPLAGTASSADPKSVWEGAPQPMPFSDVRLLVGSKSSGAVALLRPVDPTRIQADLTDLKLGDIAIGCDSSGGAPCARDHLARLRMTLVAQAPVTRILAAAPETAGAFLGECAATRLEETAQVICYQVSAAGADSARAWAPVQFDWAREGAGEAYAEGLLAGRDLSPAEERFFARAAATDGDAPALILAMASTADKAAYDRGGLAPDAGEPAGAEEAYGFLALDGDRLFALTRDGDRELPRRTGALLLDLLAEERDGGRTVTRLVASAAIADGDLLLAALEPGVGACIRRTRPETRVSCFHRDPGDGRLVEWDPISWGTPADRPLVEPARLLALIERDRDRAGPLSDPFLDRFLAVAAQRRGRHIRLYDVFSDLLDGAGWSGLALAFVIPDPAATPLLDQCRADGILLAGHTSDPIRLGLRLVPSGAVSCRAAFPETYARHRSEIRRRIAEQAPTDIVDLTMQGDRAILKTLSPARTELLHFWSGEGAERRRFPAVTAACLLDRAGEAARYAPRDGSFDEQELTRALLDADWRAQGWRANPLGLILRAESCAS